MPFSTQALSIYLLLLAQSLATAEPTGYYQARNAANQINIKFHDNITEIETHGKRLSISLTEEGPVKHATMTGPRLDRIYASGLREWFTNDAQGLEHGFILGKRRGSSGPTIHLSIEDDWQLTQTSDGIIFRQGTVRLDYAGVRAWDSRGVDVPVRLRTQAHEVVIEADDTDAVYPLTIDPTFTQSQEFTTPDATANSEFGGTLALSGDGLTALVGASGTAYVYTLNGVNWTQQAKLTAPDLYGAYEDFGSRLALSSDGSTALVGSRGWPLFDPNRLQGTVYVYTRTGSTWSLQQTLTASDGSGGDSFGSSIALSSDGSIALIGAPNKTVGPNSRQGAAYIYVLSGTLWTQQQSLTAVDGALQDGFGNSVSLSGDGSTALVGATFRNFDAGAVYAYLRSGSTWTRQQELTPSDASMGSEFGSSVALSSDGSTALVGASFKTIGSSPLQGAAYVYTRSGTIWSQQQELTASDGAAAYLFGAAAALSSNGLTALIGAPETQIGANISQGAAYVFGHIGANWTQQQRLTASDGSRSDGFGPNGAGLSSDGSTILVGAPGKTVGSNFSEGAVYAFTTAPIQKLVFTMQPSNTTAGTTLPPVVVQVQDGAGNLLTTSNVTITLTSNPAALTATASAVNGIATFANLALNATAGRYSLHASANSSIIDADSNSFTVSPGSPVKLGFTSQPINGPTGQPIVASVAVQDCCRNSVAVSGASVTLSSNPAAINSTGTTVDGFVTFGADGTLAIYPSGTYTLIASSSGLASATSNSFTIAAGGAAKLAFTTQPVNALAGAPLPPVIVQAQDGYNNLVTASNVPVTLTSSPVGVSATVAAVNGVATFTGLTFIAPGTYTFKAISPTLNSATTNSFNITVAMAGAKVGVFRNNAAFLEDYNGNAVYDPGVDRFISTFAGTGGYIAGDVPVVGDWTGDGHAKVGIYRASTGTWFLDANNNFILDAGDFVYQFGGVLGDTPAIGDWTGSGKSCVGIFRQGFFWLLDLDCNGAFDGNKDAAFPFGGLGGDVPVVGAWTGGATKVGVVREYAPAGVPQGNPFYWVPDAGAANAGPAPASHQPDYGRVFAFGGLAGDIFVTGDWFNTGTTAAGVYRAGFWVLDAALPGAPQSSHVPGLTFGYGGAAGDLPIIGKW